MLRGSGPQCMQMGFVSLMSVPTCSWGEALAASEGSFGPVVEIPGHTERGVNTKVGKRPEVVGHSSLRASGHCHGGGE